MKYQTKNRNIKKSYNRILQVSCLKLIYIFKFLFEIFINLEISKPYKFMLHNHNKIRPTSRYVLTRFHLKVYLKSKSFS
ncbi:hypothetical protein RIR_jg31466.t1 [Rhizophagus irregularis DAOM 181602=DAOM 197198]|uniref:Uncharacterized protein n=1 Tax=Rhizophagus irregularis TaxID=588596 RepID=A0A2N1N5R7_9GLOM|nr:hypothetical protein RhiirC2_510629 [Rhizophagus irregularis]GET54007.1 hypothetical protein RIR_jg31466.t1 [Rhizophagus irregularis DAOM 181602=DAOM 197198]